MSNLKRYGECETWVGDQCRTDMVLEEDGEWVKFDDIKEFLKPSHNTQSKQCYRFNACDAKKSNGCLGKLPKCFM